MHAMSLLDKSLQRNAVTVTLAQLFDALKRLKLLVIQEAQYT